MSAKINKSERKPTGLLIFSLALFGVYLIITILAAVFFEYYTVTTSGGKIIFSAVMSWQMILFVIEIATLVIQSVAVVLMLKQFTMLRFRLFAVGGSIAGAAVLITEVILLITDGLVVNPTLVFLIYALFIIGIRSLLMPLIIYKRINTCKKIEP